MHLYQVAQPGVEFDCATLVECRALVLVNQRPAECPDHRAGVAERISRARTGRPDQARASFVRDFFDSRGHFIERLRHREASVAQVIGAVVEHVYPVFDIHGDRIAVEPRQRRSDVLAFRRRPLRVHHGIQWNQRSRRDLLGQAGAVDTRDVRALTCSDSTQELLRQGPPVNHLNGHLDAGVVLELLDQLRLDLSPRVGVIWIEPSPKSDSTLLRDSRVRQALRQGECRGASAGLQHLPSRRSS